MDVVKLPNDFPNLPGFGDRETDASYLALPGLANGAQGFVLYPRPFSSDLAKIFGLPIQMGYLFAYGLQVPPSAHGASTEVKDSEPNPCGLTIPFIKIASLSFMLLSFVQIWTLCARPVFLDQLLVLCVFSLRKRLSTLGPLVVSANTALLPTTASPDSSLCLRGSGSLCNLQDLSSPPLSWLQRQTLVEDLEVFLPTPQFL
jgi:hypothetical protein